MDALRIRRRRRRIRLGRENGGHHRRVVAGALQSVGLGQRLSHRQPRGGQGAAAARSRTPVVVSVLFRHRRGRAGYEKYPSDFAKLIWRLASPKWNFDAATFDRTAKAFDNPDHVAIVIHNYRWRLGLAEGEANTRISRDGSPGARQSPCRRSLWKATPTAPRTRTELLRRKVLRPVLAPDP